MRGLLVLLVLVAVPLAAQETDIALVTAWTGTGAQADAYRPAFGQAYPACSWSDITGQPCGNLTPAPNAYTILARCPDDVADAIEDDTAYVVLWTEQVVVPVLPEAHAAAPGSWRWAMDALGSLLSPRAAEAQPARKPAKVKPWKAKAEKPPVGEVTKLRGQLEGMGYTKAQAKGHMNKDRSRSANTGSLIAAQRAAPKAQ